MEKIRLRYTFGRRTLNSGRKVEVGLSEDHTHWCFRFGDLDNPEDSVRFAISAEAFRAMEEIIGLLSPPSRRGWEPITDFAVNLGAMIDDLRQEASVPREAKELP